MDETMSIPERIKELRTSRQWKLDYLAEITGISRSTLAKYESNDYKDMSVFVLLKLADVYDVSMDYLTGLSPNKKNSDADFSKLHLSDEGIEVLQDESWNHALLDEVLTNENFKNLMVDSQVYVDRYAESIIKDSLHLLQALKSNYLLNCGTENNEVYLRMLDMVNLNDEDYLLPVIHHDLDSILSDIRENHRSDMSTMSDQTPVEILTEKLLSESGEPTENGENAETENDELDIYEQLVKDAINDLSSEDGSKDAVKIIFDALGKNSVSMAPSQRGRKKKNGDGE